MKRTFKIILTSLLAVLLISGSAVSTSALSGGRMVYYYGNGDLCGLGGCDNGNSCQSGSCPQSLSDLCDTLSRLGCSQEGCQSVYDILSRCGVGRQDCGVCPDASCDSVCPTECDGDCPADAPVPAQPAAPVTEPETEPVTAAPEQPTEQPTQAALTEAPTQPRDSELSAYELEVVRLINEIRAQNGLGQLSVSAELSRVARLKSQDMRDKNYFSHTSPTYGSPFEMMRQFGIRYRTAGENIAMGYRTPQSVVDGWMNSEGHRRNILDGRFTQIGMGYVADGSYWTQMFIG